MNDNFDFFSEKECFFLNPPNLASLNKNISEFEKTTTNSDSSS